MQFIEFLAKGFSIFKDRQVCRIEIVPDSETLANDRVAHQFIVHIEPREGIREQAVNGNKRDFAGVVRFERIETGIPQKILISLDGVKETIPSSHPSFVHDGGERRCEVSRQRK